MGDSLSYLDNLLPNNINYFIYLFIYSYIFYLFIYLNLFIHGLNIRT